MGPGGCFPGHVFQAVHHVRGPSGKVSIVLGCKSHLPSARFVSLPEWLLTALMKTLSSGSWWVTLQEIFWASSGCPVASSPEALVYLGLHFLRRNLRLWDARNRIKV